VTVLTLLSYQAAFAQSAKSKSEKNAANPPEAANPKAKQTRQEYFAEKLTTEDMLADLTELDSLLKEKWALVDANGVDFSAEIAALKVRMPMISTRFNFSLEVQKLLAKGIDGHIGVGGVLWGVSSQWRDSNGQRTPMPFGVELSGDRYIAHVWEDLEKGNPVNPTMKYRHVPLREGLPYVLEIDGIPIERWIETASEFVSKGSIDAVRSRATTQIANLGFYRKQLGLENRPVVRVKLTSEDRVQSVELQLPIKDRIYGPLPVARPESKLLDGNFGYMWFQVVSGQSEQMIIEKMPQFRTTNGLIVDLRDCHGGTPGSLTFLAAFLLPPENHTMIAGACEVEEENVNGGHGFFTPKTPGMREAEIKLMADFDKRYHPTWIPRNRKTPLHRTYIPLTNPVASGAQYMPWGLLFVRLTQIPKIYHYEKPVVLLVNHRCFSGGEILAAMLRDLPNVTIVGSPSSAGGCVPSGFKLTKTGLELGFGIRACVRANGDLIDGNGVTPHVVVHPDPDYYFGARDRALEKAVEIIQSGEARH